MMGDAQAAAAAAAGPPVGPEQMGAMGPGGMPAPLPDQQAPGQALVTPENQLL